MHHALETKKSRNRCSLESRLDNPPQRRETKTCLLNGNQSRSLRVSAPHSVLQVIGQLRLLVVF